MAEWLLYEHDDGRHAVAPSAEAATFAHGDPAWHRAGPVEVPASRPADPEAVLAEVVKWGLAGHISEAGVTVEAGKAIRAAASGAAKTAVPRLKPLKEEQIIDATEHISMEEPGCFIRIARAIERAHGIGVMVDVTPHPLLSAPTLYERTGDVKDCNTLLVNRGELRVALGVGAVEAPRTLKGYEGLLLDVIQRARLPAADAWTAYEALAALVVHATDGVNPVEAPSWWWCEHCQCEAPTKNVNLRPTHKTCGNEVAPADGVRVDAPAQPLPAGDPRVSALRWLLNITTEFDRKDVRTRQAARLLDEFSGGDGRTNRELLEDLWRLVSGTDGVPLPPATFRQGNWAHPDGIGRIVGWIIPNEAVERMGADAYVLPGEVEDALTRLAAAHGVDLPEGTKHG